MPQRTVFLEEDYPVYLVMKGRETDEAVALINVERQNDDRFLSKEIQDLFEQVYKIEQISEAQFETYELFGVPTTLPLNMTFILIGRETGDYKEERTIGRTTVKDWMGKGFR